MSAQKGEAEMYILAIKRLDATAQEFGCPLDELMDWFEGSMDMLDIARFTRSQVRQSVRFYIDNQQHNNEGVM